MCLAKKIGGVQLVEPFVMGSLLGLNVSANWTNEVKMLDIFDYKHGNIQCPLRSMVNSYHLRTSCRMLLENY